MEEIQKKSPTLYQQTDRLTGKTVACVCIGRSEVLRSLRHYLQSQNLRIFWRRDTKKRVTVDDLPWKGDMGPLV